MSYIWTHKTCSLYGGWALFAGALWGVGDYFMTSEDQGTKVTHLAGLVTTESEQQRSIVFVLGPLVAGVYKLKTDEEQKDDDGEAKTSDGA